jgi:hypothetical protein
VLGNKAKMDISEISAAFIESDPAIPLTLSSKFNTQNGHPVTNTSAQTVLPVPFHIYEFRFWIV